MPRIQRENQALKKVVAAKIFKLKWDEAKLHPKYIELKDNFNKFIKENNFEENENSPL